MEYYQAIQERSAQTGAVAQQYFPTMNIVGITADDLLEKSQALIALAQQRDDALIAFDAASSARNQGYLTLRSLIFVLPRIAQGQLDDVVAAESALLDYLSPVFAIDPRNTDLAIKRGLKLVAALTQIDEYLASLTPPRAPVRSGGKGVDELSAAITAQLALAQAYEMRGTDVSVAREALRVEATALDRLNKRFYKMMRGEARENETLTKALEQIDTGPNRPATLSIYKTLQGGTESRQVLVSYVIGSYDDKATNIIEWKVDGVDAAFTHSVAVDPSGNAIGPFKQGQTIQLRTRATNSNGGTVGSTRKITIT